MSGWWMLWVLGGMMILAYLIVLSLRRVISPVRRSDRPLDPGNIHVPDERSINWKNNSSLTTQILNDWSSRENPSWKTMGKVDAPRIFLSKLYSKKELELINELMQAVQPWGKIGSTWWMNKKGDYDFAMVPLISILYLFGDKESVLETSTRDHIVKDLLKFPLHHNSKYVPWTFFLAFETENHVLMIESSRYLKNRWLEQNKIEGFDHCDIEGSERSLLEYLKKIKQCGFYEFNSDPYAPYTITALLNLEAFGSSKVSSLSRELLDGLFFGYAIGSYDFRRMVPFQRQLKKAGKSSFTDPLDPFMKVYCSLHPKGKGNYEMTTGSKHALMAYLLPYRPPDGAMKMVLERNDSYYVRIGHGKMMSPEIYSGGSKFLLTAGGTNRGLFSRIVARPITLLLDDHARELKETLHTFGPTSDLKTWNNTGVYDKFAVCAGKVRVPKKWEPKFYSKVWRIYRQSGVTIGIHSRPELGIIAVLDMTPEEAAIALDRLNYDEKRLKTLFEYPGGESIRYDVFSPKGQWVIDSVGEEDVNRKYDNWPLLNGFINKNE